MTVPAHLLPSNARLFEQEMSRATDYLARLAPSADAIRAFKNDPGDVLLPWLLWEYGLGELLPYLPDPRRAIRDGIRWQRLRGTPAALTTALSWIGATATVEQEPPGVHFAEFQLDPGQVLDSDEAIANLIAIARLSAPARSRLSRITHGYDLRRFVLDDSALGEALLSDHSGVVWRDGLTRLSFGRVRKFALPAMGIEAHGQREAARFIAARLQDRVLLDFSALGDPGHTRNEEILHSHLFTLSNAAGVLDPLGLSPERRFCRAMVALSDSTSLGDTNANLPRFVWREEGRTIRLGAGDALSATPHRLVRVEVLERIDAGHASELVVSELQFASDRQSAATYCVHARADQHLGTLTLGNFVPSFDRGWMRRQHNRGNDPLPDAAGWRARLFQRAQCVLSESVLGEVNTRTPRFGFIRRFPVPKLGDIRLGSVAEVETAPLTEMQIGISTLTLAAPFDFEASRSALSRLITCSNAAVDALAHPSREHLASSQSAWIGQTWTGTRWPASSWNDTREVVGSTHTQ